MHRNIHDVDVNFVGNVPERRRLALPGASPAFRASGISRLLRTVRGDLDAAERLIRSWARIAPRMRR
jgi:hypothetical protein